MTKIYILERNRVPFYIGKTKGNWRENKHKLKFGEDINFIEIDTVEDCEWLFWEKYYISLYKSWGFILVNKNNGGGGPEQYTEEQKQKMRKPHKEGTGEKISKALTGIKRGPQSEETKQKIKLVRTGKPQPNISKANKGRTISWASKIGDALRGVPKNYPNPNKKIIYQYDINNNLINQYNSAAEAGKALNKSGNSIADCASGRQKTAYGFVWKYASL
jgi:hypothetical protein